MVEKVDRVCIIILHSVLRLLKDVLLGKDLLTLVMKLEHFDSMKHRL